MRAATVASVLQCWLNQAVLAGLSYIAGDFTSKIVYRKFDEDFMGKQ